MQTFDEYLRGRDGWVNLYNSLRADEKLANPYHNFAHTDAVARLAYVFVNESMASDNIEPPTSLHLRFTIPDVEILVLAALLHDYDHQGVRAPQASNDAQNIKRAVTGLRELFQHRRPVISTPRTKRALGWVEFLIRTTQFPHASLQYPEPPHMTQEQFDLQFPIFERMRRLALILRDADVLSALLPVSQENVLYGLPREIHRHNATPPSTVEWVKSNNQFLSNYEPHSKEGRAFKEAHLNSALARFTQAAAQTTPIAP